MALADITESHRRVPHSTQIDHACEWSGFSRTRLEGLVNAGSVRAVRAARQTLVRTALLCRDVHVHHATGAELHIGHVNMSDPSFTLVDIIVTFLSVSGPTVALSRHEIASRRPATHAGDMSVRTTPA